MLSENSLLFPGVLIGFLALVLTMVIHRLQTSRWASNETRQLEKWIRQAFWFLVEHYGFRYEGYGEGHSDFVSDKVKIRVEPGHKTPNTYVYRIGEPEFTRLYLERILEYLDGILSIVDFQTHSLERNLEIQANILEERGRNVISEIDDWWIPIQKFQYERLRE